MEAQFYDYHGLTVNDALYNLELHINKSKHGNRFICLSVGYGSTGKTKKIRTAILEKLVEYKEKHIIKTYLLGEHMGDMCPEYINYLKETDSKYIAKNGLNKGFIYIVS